MIQKISTFIFAMLLLMGNFSCSNESSAPQNLFTGSSDDSSEPIVCTLSEEDLILRKEALKKDLFSKVIKKEEAENGYIFYFKDEEGLLTQLTEFILFEQKCCKFFHYDLSVQSHGKGIAMKISGPLGVKMFMDDVTE